MIVFLEKKPKKKIYVLPKDIKFNTLAENVKRNSKT